VLQTIQDVQKILTTHAIRKIHNIQNIQGIQNIQNIQPVRTDQGIQEIQNIQMVRFMESMHMSPNINSFVQEWYVLMRLLQMHMFAIVVRPLSWRTAIALKVCTTIIRQLCNNYNVIIVPARIKKYQHCMKLVGRGLIVHIPNTRKFVLFWVTHHTNAQHCIRT